MRGFRLKSKSGTRQNGMGVVYIRGGLPMDHPDYKRSGLPDYMPNREPEMRDLITGLLPSEMNDVEFQTYCERAGLNPVQARADIEQNARKPAPWLKAQSAEPPTRVVDGKAGGKNGMIQPE